MISGHSFPFSANNIEKYPLRINADNPNTTTDQLILSTARIAGITTDAKETSEMFAESVDNARSFECESLNIYKSL